MFTHFMRSVKALMGMVQRPNNQQSSPSLDRTTSERYNSEYSSTMEEGAQRWRVDGPEGFSRSGLTKSEAEELLDWLDRHGHSSQKLNHQS